MSVDMDFATGHVLVLLLVVPIMAALVAAWLRRDAARRLRYGEAGLLRRLNPGGPSRRASRMALFIVAFALLVLASGRPRAGREWSEAQGAGVDVALAVDVSNSMRAPDVSFGASRLDGAIRICDGLLGKLEYDRVGLVTFTDKAATVCPLTADMGAVSTMLRGIGYEEVGEGGTSLAEALQEACARFDPESERGRIVVILSDGEDHERGIEPGIEAAKKLSATVHTVGLGSREGSSIPEGSGFFSGYKRYRGNVIVTRLQEDILRRVADETEGRYSYATGRDTVEELARLIGDAKNKGITVRTATTRREVFQFPVALALAMLAFEMLLPSLGREGRRDP